MNYKSDKCRVSRRSASRPRLAARLTANESGGLSGGPRQLGTCCEPGTARAPLALPTRARSFFTRHSSLAPRHSAA